MPSGTPLMWQAARLYQHTRCLDARYLVRRIQDRRELKRYSERTNP
ncbi:hypothetical protein [Streptomyces chryseus]|nr:hypothetical protein [Streptomyces chryseus]GGX29505.1 hypothetical protein GCM10010353_50990 [Streptomyces chryseus]